MRLKVWSYSRYSGRSGFQYPKVRLKEYEWAHHPLGDSISIPEGAIKSPDESSRNPDVTSFQYPKVRLKGTERWLPRRRNGISIPEGAIKSNEKIFNLRLNDWISIPEGAIKSVGSGVSGVSGSVFQYPKVRLKANQWAKDHKRLTNFNTRRCD